MAETGSLNLYVHGADVSDTAAVANILSVDEMGSVDAVETGVVLPMGEKNVWRTFALKPGNYLVQTRLQTGALVNSQVSIKAGEAMELGVADPLKAPNLEADPGNDAPGSELPLPAVQLYEPAELTVRGLRDLLKAAASAEAAPEAVATYMEPERDAAGGLIDPLVDAARIAGEKRVDISSLRGGLGHPPTDPRSQPVYLSCVDGGNAWLARVPIAWPPSGGKTGFEIQVYRGDLPGVAVLPPDPDKLPLLEFLRRRDVSVSHELVLAAAGSLFGKAENPAAAAAGALVLVLSRRWNPQARLNPEWTEWIGNLERNYEEISDGLILRAWVDVLDASSGSEANDEARIRFRRDLVVALDKPVPIYTGTFTLLCEGIKLTADLKVPDFETDDLVNLTTLRLDPRQVFTTFRLTAEAPNPSPFPRG